MNIKFDNVKDKAIFTAGMRRLRYLDWPMYLLLKEDLSVIHHTTCTDTAQSRLDQMSGAVEYRVRSNVLDNPRFWIDFFHVILWAEVIPMNRRAQMVVLNERKY